MAKKIFINLPVEDLAKSTEFYEKLGFAKDPMFSDNNASLRRMVRLPKI